MKDNFYKKKFRSEHHKLMANINYTGAFFTAALAKGLENYNITHPQFIILRAMQHSLPGFLSMSEVKEQMHDRNSDITRLVDRLIDKKLVLREVDPENRRRVMLKLTEHSMDLLGKIEKDIENFEYRFHDISEKDVDFMNILLDKIREKIVLENEK